MAIITFSLASAVIVPLLGLGMDAAMLCVVKERLTSAAESAAHAAARYPDHEASVKRFLDANFPEGYMGTTARTIKVDANQVWVKVDAPTYFMKLLHVRTVEVAASAAVIR
jgi:hypothetical protein